MKKILLGAAVSTLLLGSCNVFQKGSVKNVNVVTLDTLEVTPMTGIYPYRASRKRVVDLLHTRLEVKFDWEKQYLYGKAWLDLKPYFYATNSFEIDAKGFDINEVSYKNGKDVRYSYDGNKLKVELDKTYTRKDSIQLYIEYTAKPNELEEGGSEAITSDKGLYFINPNGEEKNKPQQIWTQGETQASSCWFPTIDAPNERTSMEIGITVQNKFKTLSNGVLIFSEDNGDGTRTDHWEQTLPHAPYLFMMAVGEYVVVKDTWRDSIDVNYYVEPKYEASAKEIFNHTPEMLEFFSNLLGYKYPWDKYSQVIVRDYVSGAMENTSAVIFGEFVQKTHRELIDDGNEDIVAHEMFHHWFGDLVTCESWANLPLNESFATYSEYLWREHKHGRDNADIHLESERKQYLAEFNSGKSEDMIRFYFSNREDMFDSHSYAKGSRILHMLRKYVGDEAFFEGLKTYLHDNEYQAVEIHNLRLAFEKVTGEDLNWFFNQWFLDKGHPDLEINYSFDDSLKIQTVEIEQKQDIAEFPIYKLPIAIDIYEGATPQRHQVVVDSLRKVFKFKVNSAPKLVNVDAEKMLLATKKDNKSIEQFIYQYDHAPLVMDRMEAMIVVYKYARKNEQALETVFKSFADKNWSVRKKAIKKIKRIVGLNDAKLMAALEKIAKEDAHSQVRSMALAKLAEHFSKEVNKNLFVEKINNDSSYLVISNALEGLFIIDKKKGLEEAKKFEKDDNGDILLSVAHIYAQDSKANQSEFMLGLADRVTGYNKMAYTSFLGNYLINVNKPSITEKGLVILKEEAMNQSNAWYKKYYAIDAMKSIRAMYIQQKNTLEKQASVLEKEGKATEAQTLSLEVERLKQKAGVVDQIFDEIKATETDKRVLQFVE